MNISELSKLSGLNAPTIRYYEQISLLPKPKRLSNGYRKYSATDLQQLNLIKQAQQVGFSLAEIKTLLPANVSSRDHDKLIETLKQKITEIEELEHKMSENKKNLQVLMDLIRNKPEGLTCEENAKRLMNLYYPESDF